MALLFLPEEAEKDLVARENERERDLCKKKVIWRLKNITFWILGKKCKSLLYLDLDHDEKDDKEEPRSDV